MREVIVEHVSSGIVRTVQVGRINKPKHIEKFVGVISSSSRMLTRSSSDDSKPSDTKCWKTTKRGEPHAKRGWQRHYNRMPSRRRHRWGKIRGYAASSAKTLNELDRCIYPNVCC